MTLRSRDGGLMSARLAASSRWRGGCLPTMHREKAIRLAGETGSVRDVEDRLTVVE